MAGVTGSNPVAPIDWCVHLDGVSVADPAHAAFKAPDTARSKLVEEKPAANQKDGGKHACHP